MATYFKIKKYEDGDLMRTWVEPATEVGIAIEIELEDAEIGTEFKITVVDMSDEQYEELAASEGY